MKAPGLLRSRDTGMAFGGDPVIWVHCPRCSEAARILYLGMSYKGYRARLSCSHCGFAYDDPQMFAVARARSVSIARWTARCDRCGKPIADRSGRFATRRGADLTMRVRCVGCGYLSTFPAIAQVERRVGSDPIFGLPLFLTEQIGSHLLWARNPSHVAQLQAWLGAVLRERYRGAAGMTMIACLPRWMKVARCRPAVIAALARLAVRAESLS